METYGNTAAAAGNEADDRGEGRVGGSTARSGGGVGTGGAGRGGSGGSSSSGGGEGSAQGEELSEWQLFALQAAAVFRKNAVVQRRAWCQNTCLLGLPLLFCILLLILQRLVNTQLGASDDYRCGCKCLECCDWLAADGSSRGAAAAAAAALGAGGGGGNSSGAENAIWQCYKATPERPCSPYAQCKARDRSQCGSQYSTYAQIAFCDVRHPSTWPAVLQVPLEEFRPLEQYDSWSIATSPVIVPYTGQQPNTSGGLSSLVVPPGGDKGIGGRILRDLREAQQRIRRDARAGNISAASNSTSTSSTGSRSNGAGTSNPILAAMAGALSSGSPAASRAAAAAAATANTDEDAVTNVDLCDPRVDVTALLLRSTGPPTPPSLSSTSPNIATSITAASNGAATTTGTAPAAAAATLTEEQIANAASALTQILSDYDIILGTPTDAPYTNLLEPALIRGSRVFGASRGLGSSSTVRGGGGGGGGAGLLGGAGGGGNDGDSGFITDPSQALPLYHLSRNCTALSATDRLVLRQLGCLLSRGLGLPNLTCASWLPAWRQDVPTIERELYCGWAGAQCSDSTRSSNTSNNATSMLQPLQLSAAMSTTAQGGIAGGSSGGRRLLLSAPAAAGEASGSAHNASGGMAEATAEKMETEEDVIVQYPSAVYDWRGTSATNGLDLTIWVNNSNLEASVAPHVQRWPAAVNAAANAWLAAASKGVQQQKQAWVARLSGIKGFPTRGSPLSLDLASLMGPLFFMWVMQLLLPTYVYSLVSERESGAQLLMRQQGLRQAPAALAAYCWFALLYGTFMVIFVGFGAAIGLNVFTKTAPGVQIVFYIVWGHTMVAWSFWFAAIWGEVATATLAATCTVVLTGLVANMIVAQFVTAGPAWLATLLEAFPSFALFRGLWEMSQYAFLAASNGGPGLTWSRLRDPGNGMVVALALLAAVAVWSAMCAWYWGQVFGPDDLGVRSHPFFFLGFRLGPDDPRGWDWFTPGAARRRWQRWLMRAKARAQDRKRGAAAAGLGAMEGANTGAPENAAAALGGGTDTVVNLAATPPPPAVPASDVADNGLVDGGEVNGDEEAAAAATVDAEGEDVRQERARVERLWRRFVQELKGVEVCEEERGDAGVTEELQQPPALLLRNIRKVFPGQGPGGRPHAAVRNLSLVVGPRETLGLLGPNGAGKTTTLRIMQGILEPSSGTVHVCGLDLASEPGRVARLVGICPQHDVLWPTLTGREHVQLFGRIKGLCGSALEAAVQAGLQEAGLAAVADRVAGGYSGGMQRRLSVVCALVGSPRVLYLDEPSTGLDPASRRLLWKAVLRAKSRCAVVLTTHSMEEAEALCDRLGVVVGGRLRCIGTPQQLLARYSSYLMLSLTVAPSADAEAERFVRTHISAAAKQVYCLNGYHSYEVPRDEVGLAALFRTMTAAMMTQPSTTSPATIVTSFSTSTSVVSFSRKGSVRALGMTAAGLNVAGAKAQEAKKGEATTAESAEAEALPPAAAGQRVGEQGWLGGGMVDELEQGIEQGQERRQQVALDEPQRLKLGLVDWAVSSATLESVFTRIAREAGAVVEAAGP